MGLLDMARGDMERFTSDDSGFFASSATITSVDGETTLDVKGLHTKHHTSYDEEGRVISTKQASISISEKQFITAEFTVRNSKGEVSMKGCVIEVADSTTSAKKYIVRENFADEALGLIVLILGDYV
jgi:hypothetical protein